MHCCDILNDVLMKAFQFYNSEIERAREEEVIAMGLNK